MQINDCHGLQAANDGGALIRKFGLLLAMSMSNEFCRFAADCVKLARAAEDERNRTVFLQMARVWVALAEKEDTSAGRNRNKEKIDHVRQ
jgi:hypothetical protein